MIIYAYLCAALAVLYGSLGICFPFVYCSITSINMLPGFYPSEPCCGAVPAGASCIHRPLSAIITTVLTITQLFFVYIYTAGPMWQNIPQTNSGVWHLAIGIGCHRSTAHTVVFSGWCWYCTSNFYVHRHGRAARGCFF